MTDNRAEPASETPPGTPESDAAQDPMNSLSPSPDSGRVTSGPPRGLIIILGLAASVVVAAGIHQVPGILAPTRSARNAALIALAGELPISLVSDLFDISITTAVNWARRAGRDWNAYLAATHRGALG